MYYYVFDVSAQSLRRDKLSTLSNIHIYTNT